MFCDMVDSTAIAELVGAESMHTLINRFFELALQSIHQYEGTINQFLGDGFMALFGAPLAYEDHARRALRAALSLLDQLQVCNDEFTPGRIRLNVRLAINTGPVVVGKIGDNLRMDYTAIGDTTNLAARLQSLAEPGVVYISEHTHRMVQEYCDCTCLGARRIKGKTNPVMIYKVNGMRALAQTQNQRVTRFLSSPLVGRAEELGTLRRCMERLITGEGGLVSVIGDAGLGKSRLLFEVKREMTRMALLWFEGRTASFSRMISFLPFQEIIREFAGITENDKDSDCWDKLEQPIRSLFPDDPYDLLPPLATLIGIKLPEAHEHRLQHLTGESMGRLLRLSTYRFFEKLARKTPLVLVFEDIHWLDQSSIELMEHLFKLTSMVPLLICWVARPEQDGPHIRLHQVSMQRFRNRYTTLHLSSLSNADCHVLVGNLLKSYTLPARLQEIINRRAEGNPFFIEEVIRSLVDAKALYFDEKEGQWRSTPGAEGTQIPETLEGVIMARIDRLEENSKELVKVASVVGRTFWRRILLEITQEQEQLDERLVSLQEMDLIRERRLIPEVEYIFKHAITQKAIYLSILQKRRQDLHRLVGQCLEQVGSDRIEGIYGLLAYHYVQAGAWEKALEFLLKAGDQAGSMAADVEALDHYQQALDAYTQVFGDRWDPVQRAMLERKIGEAWFRRGDHVAATEHLMRASGLLGFPYSSTRWGTRIRIVRELTSQLAYRLFHPLLQRTLKSSRTSAWNERSEILLRMPWIDWFINQERFVCDVLLVLNFSERAGFLHGIALGSACMGFVCGFLSLINVGERYLARAVTLADEMNLPIAVAVAQYLSGLHEYHLKGKWQKALEHFQRTVGACNEVRDLRGWGMASFWIAWILRARGDFIQPLQLCNELIHLGEAAGDQLVYAYGRQGTGRTLYCLGKYDSAIEQFKQWHCSFIHTVRQVLFAARRH
jgi:class 3 adenylate cyclase/tetratricopeptide (TPR) repeat protein